MFSSEDIECFTFNSKQSFFLGSQLIMAISKIAVGDFFNKFIVSFGGTLPDEYVKCH